MEGNLNYHKKDFHASYKDQKEDTKPFIEKFISERLPMFFNYFEKVLDSHPGEYIMGGKLSYPDLTLFQALRVIESDLLADWDTLKGQYPNLAALHAKVGSFESIKAFLASSKYQPEGHSFMWQHKFQL